MRKRATKKKEKAIDPESFAGRLKTHRKALGLTLEETAALLQVSPRSYYAWENGETIPLEVTQEGALARLENTSRE